jgi:hypothetical protein
LTWVRVHRANRGTGLELPHSIGCSPPAHLPLLSAALHGLLQPLVLTLASVMGSFLVG